MNLRTKLLAVGFILILSSSTAVYYYLYKTQLSNQEPEGNDKIFVDLESSFGVEDDITYRGNSYASMLNLTINTTITLHHMELTIEDPVYQRTGIQNFTINQTLNEGTHQLTFSVTPSFPEDEGVVISVPDTDYPLQQYTLYYNTTDHYNATTEIDDINLRAKDAPIYDQAKSLEWNTSIDTGSISVDKGTINVSSIQASNFSMLTTINTTGYTRLDYSQNSTGADFVFLINGSTYAPTAQGSIPVGNLKGIHNLTILGEVQQGGSVNLTIELLTKSVALFVAIGDNNWDGIGSEDFKFREPSFYLDLVSFQFEQLFNVTLVHGKTVNIGTPVSRDYDKVISSLLKDTGEKLGLENGNWTYGTGSFEENEGFDILLLFTNRTMEYLGIVYGNITGSFNMAIHARGSRNTGDYRLPPSFADNLVQHEISHVFGAPDRFTDSSPPSIMTKSRPDDAVDDIIFGTFWLYLTNWLEEDIQTMTDKNRSLYWN